MQTISVLSLRKDEIQFIGESVRCETCGHLRALHNEHCCQFCTVPGCRCRWDYWDGAREGLSDELPGGGYLDVPVVDAPLCNLYAEVVA